MKFQPKSADEIVMDSLLNPGIYPFEVMSAEDQFSKSGNEMIKLKLAVFGPDNQQAHVYDYLLEKLAHKLRHFAEAVGLLAKYESGELSAFDCREKTGYVKLIVDDKDPAYPPKNTVKDYVPEPKEKPAVQESIPMAPKHQAAMAAQAPAPAPKAAFDDDIPF